MIGELQTLRNGSFLTRRLIKSLALGMSFIPFGTALAVEDHVLPSGSNVITGNVTFDYSIENQLHIQQNSDRTVINWDSFNIGKNSLTQFHQNNSSSIAVNRVTGTGQDPTQILGTLKSNGIVMVLDRNGVLFGQDSVVDVGGIIASTGNIDDTEFMNGSNIVDLHDMDATGSIVNEGTITVAQGGLAAFVAPHIVNNGIINVKMGRVALASGTQATLDLYGDGLVELAVDDAFEDALIENNGSINAAGGNVLITVPTAQNVVGNLININGVINVSSVTQKGGKIVLEGGNINLAGTLEANGKEGGGTIHVGGEYLGAGDTRHAQSVYISDDALIEASAFENGDGGEVIVWSDQETWMAGTIKSKGGFYSGNGGFIETSSKDYLRIRGYADASAFNGKAGQWLLDPSNVSIVNGAGFDASGGGTVNPTTDSYTVDADTIETALNAGTSVTITTTNGAGTEAGDITMTGATINKTAGADTSLTLQADNSIILTNSTISSTTGALDVTLHADSDNNDAGYIHLDDTDITTNGGDFVAGGGLNPLTDYAWGDAALDDGVTIEGGSQILTGSGDVSIMGHARNNAASSNLTGIVLSQGTDIVSTTGDITLDGIGGDGAINNYGVFVTGSTTSVSSSEGGILITGQGGSAGIGDTRNNHGILIQGSDVISTGTGVNAATITLNGTGSHAGARRNHGVSIGQNNTEITSVDGDINIIGQGGDGTTNENMGVRIEATADITSTGTGANAANISINGTGGTGTNSNYGVYMEDAGTTVTTVDGSLSITGQGGSDGSSISNHGIYTQLGVVVSSTGTGAGAGTITLDGTGGNGTTDNYGVYLTDTGTIITSADGDIDITGQGGTNGLAGSNDNYGVYAESGADIISTGTGINAATITIDGTGGAGEDLNHGVYLDGGTTEVSSVVGDISITGQGGSGLDDSNYGVYLNNGVVSSTGVGTDVADILINGTGGTTSGRGNHGSYLRSGDVTTVDGDISIIGLGGSNGGDQGNIGIQTTNGMDITSTGVGAGAGTITLNGTGSPGSQYHHGVNLASNTQITSIDGDISITGQGGGTTSQFNAGIQIYGGTDIISTGTGVDAAQIILDGTGGNGTRFNSGVIAYGLGTTITSVDGDIDITGRGRGTTYENYGIRFYDQFSLSSTGTGADAATITINGTGADGTIDNYGVYMTDAGTIVTSVDGDIDITGQGGDGSGADNYGAYFTGGADITSTGVGVNAATITIDGTGGDGTEYNYGIFMDDNNTSIDTVDGDISITGQGGSDGTNRTNSGIYIIRSDITSTGTGADAGTITLNGTGANGTRDNVGVALSHVNSEITSVDGNITIIGQGGHGTNDANQGVTISSIVSSTGTGADAANITINGTGGNGANENYGIMLRDTGSVISTVDGDLSITGQGGDGVQRNYGIWVRQDVDVTSTGVGVNAGNITLNGIGGNGTNDNYGVYLDAAGTTISSTDGNVSVTAQGQGSGINNDDFFIDDADITTTNSDIELSADTYVLANAANISAGNDLNITARTNGTSIGLGAGAGTLNLDNTELNLLDAVGSVRIGEVASASTINIDNVNVAGAGYDIEIIGGAITIDNGLTGGGTVFLQSTANQDITLNDIVTAVGAGDSLVLASDDEIINNFGVGVLDPGVGRYLAFVESPNKITANGLNPSEIYNEIFTSLGAVSISGAVDNFVYEILLDVSSDIFDVDPYLAEENAKVSFTLDPEVIDSSSEEIKGSGCLANYGNINGSCLVGVSY